MHKRTSLALAVMCVAVCTIVWRSSLIGAEDSKQLIIRCERPCAAVVAAVAGLGGEVTEKYENIDAVAVKVPTSRVGDLTVTVGADAVRKDVAVALPPRLDLVNAGDPAATSILEENAIGEFVRDLPANYNYNNGLTGAASLHAANNLGQGIIVAVIDSGTASVAPALTGTVIGGENLVPSAQDPVASATSRLNDWHGTAVGDMIAAHANFVFLNTSTLVRSVKAHAPQSVLPCPGPPFSGQCPATASIIPMIGTAPGAKIYALKVFPSQGGGAPESRIIAAMDRAITLRRNYNQGMSTAPVSGAGTENDPFRYNALPIQVANMSLGGPTLFAGGDLEDQLTEEMVEVGITLTTSAGNDGFAAMTGGSPGTGMGSLTVGAASTPVHERILRDIQFGFGIGDLYRPFDGIQTAYFSSRGPTADGRFDPDLSANGFASYVNVFAASGALSCGAPGAVACVSRILFVSGTSFSSPTVAGAAALLRAAPEGASASALRIRDALGKSGDPELIGDGSKRIDRGSGFVNIPAALTQLARGYVNDDGRHEHHQMGWHDDRDDEPDEVGAGGRSVIANVRRLGFRPVQFINDRFRAEVRNLLPGQVAQFFVPSNDQTDRLIVRISSVTPELPPDEQNVFFGDDLFVMGVDAPTSFAVHRIVTPQPPASPFDGAFVNADTAFTIDNPQNGLVRIAIQGDWTNAGRISATLTIERQRGSSARVTATGKIRQGDSIPIMVDVPSGAAQAVFEVFWKQNWSRYPANDVDMVLYDPAGHLFNQGATLNSPERVTIATPAAGRWTAVISGFTIQQHRGSDSKDTFTFRASVDGKRLKVAR